MSDTSLQKRSTRTRFEIFLVVQTPERTIRASKSKNISLTGIYVETNEKIPINTECSIEITNTSNEDHFSLIKIKGVVAREGSDGIGIQFKDVDEKTMEELKKVIELHGDEVPSED